MALIKSMQASNGVQVTYIQARQILVEAIDKGHASVVVALFVDKAQRDVCNGPVEVLDSHFNVAYDPALPATLHEQVYTGLKLDPNFVGAADA